MLCNGLDFQKDLGLCNAAEHNLAESIIAPHHEGLDAALGAVIADLKPSVL